MHFNPCFYIIVINKFLFILTFICIMKSIHLNMRHDERPYTDIDIPIASATATCPHIRG